MTLQSVYKEWKAGHGLLYTWFSAMHTRIDIILCDQPEKELKIIADKIYNEVNRIEKLASYYDISSELYKLNNEASQTAIVIDKELFGMIIDCIDYNEKTHGYFDIAVKSDNYNNNILSQLGLDKADTTIYYKGEGIRIDLSGYLKGYALDSIHKILGTHQISNALINMGNSSVMAIGNHPHGKGWKVSYGHISGTGSNQSINLYDECLTTSGNESRDRKHIINPSTGEYVEGVKRLSVITRKGREGEILSTAMFIADPYQREEISRSFNIKYYET